MAEVTWAVTVGDEVFEVVLEKGSADGVYLLTVPGEGKEGDGSQISLHHVHGEKYMVKLDSRNITVFLSRVRGGYRAVLFGHEFITRIEEARLFHLKKAMAAQRRGSEPADIVAPMPGLVLSVEVEEGQEVAEGEGIAVVESMKMENEIKATLAGTIDKVMVEAGQVVDKGQALVRLVPRGEP